MSTSTLKNRFNWQKLQSNEHTIMAVLAVMVGLAGGMGAVGISVFDRLLSDPGLWR